MIIFLCLVYFVYFGRTLAFEFFDGSFSSFQGVFYTLFLLLPLVTIFES